jgi:hypothetical protein
MAGTRARDEQIAAIVTEATGSPVRELRLSARPLRGGLDGGAVTEILARFRDERGRARSFRLVAKRLAGPSVREADAYERLVARHAERLGPRILRISRGRDGAVLYMAADRRRAGWPWRDVATAAVALEAVAQLHGRADAVRDVPAWDYEAELAGRSLVAIEALERARRNAALAFVAGSLPAARRLVEDLRRWRGALLAGPLAPCAIHGDLHSGNVMVAGGAPPRVVLIDWGRSRAGSPFEDVCSWLQSLAFWEPAVRRKHDTLLGRYLEARGAARAASGEVRAAYWLAGASNALAGAIAFHLEVCSSVTCSPRQRAASAGAVRDWLRILRRADAYWSSPV